MKKDIKKPVREVRHWAFVFTTDIGVIRKLSSVCMIRRQILKLNH